jgi:hypothetical protein
MLSKQHLADAMTHECDVAIHLYGKLTPEALDYRPSPGQRSTLELMRYLAMCGIAGVTCMAANNWKLFGEFVARTKEMPAEGFPAAMEQQKRELQEFFAKTDDKTLMTQSAPMPAGGTLPLGAAIVSGPFKWLSAYRLQLFVNAKASGARDLVTSNAWRGVDPKPAA